VIVVLGLERDVLARLVLLVETLAAGIGVVLDLDARVLERDEDRVHLVGRDELILQELVHLRVGQNALLATLVDEVLDRLLDLLSHDFSLGDGCRGVQV
jgi:hypothetical protein